MTELNKTRKIFVFMFFSMTILPVTTIIIFMYTFDEPKIDRVDLKTNIQESNLLTKVEEPNDSIGEFATVRKRERITIIT